jgi:hypothetical protein
MMFDQIPVRELTSFGSLAYRWPGKGVHNTFLPLLTLADVLAAK